MHDCACPSKHTAASLSAPAEEGFENHCGTSAGKAMPPRIRKVIKKSKGLEKHKGLGKPKGLEKPTKKGKLTAKSLGQLGQLSLKDKMQQAAEQSDTPESAALVLYENMTKNEKAKAWSKHQTALKKKTDEEKAEQEKEGKQYMAALKKASTSETCKQRDTWESELQMLQKWTPQELDLHIKSGRIQWRECPGTWNVLRVQGYSRLPERAVLEKAERVPRL